MPNHCFISFKSRINKCYTKIISFTGQRKIFLTTTDFTSVIKYQFICEIRLLSKRYFHHAQERLNDLQFKSELPKQSTFKYWLHFCFTH